MEAKEKNDLEKENLSENRKEARIEISISGERSEIRIGKGVVRLLGSPAFLCLKVNKAMDSIAVMPCAGKEYMSFKVPEGIMQSKNISMRVRSRMFVEEILASNGFKNDRTYQGTGVFLEKNNAVLFSMTDLTPVGEVA